MRKIYQPKRFLRMVFLLLCTGFMSSAFAQLSGTYTIDNTHATAGTNYQYNVDTADTNLMTQLAGLQAATPAQTPAPAAPPAEDKQQQYDFSKVDFVGLGKMIEANKKPKKSVNRSSVLF